MFDEETTGGDENPNFNPPENVVERPEENYVVRFTYNEVVAGDEDNNNAVTQKTAVVIAKDEEAASAKLRKAVGPTLKNIAITEVVSKKAIVIA